MKNKTVLLWIVFLLYCLTACNREQSGMQNTSDALAVVSSTGAEEVMSSEHPSSSSSEGTDTDYTQAESENKGLRITVTSFPIYDWVRSIIGNQCEDVEVMLLNTEGEDYHSFRPDAETAEKIEESDIFFCIGGKSEKWAYQLEEEYLKKAEKSDQEMHLPKMIFLLEKLNDYVIKPEADESADSDEQTIHFYSDAVESLDEHIWLSPVNAYDLCTDILEILKDTDEKNAAVYEENATVYLEKLNDLDNAYLDAADTASCKTVLIAGRNPFHYLTDTYLLESYALFDECPQTESEEPVDAVREMTILVQNNDYKKIIVDIDAQDDNYVFLTNQLKDRAIELIELQSMHGVSFKDAEEGASYISVMEENLENLRRILDF